MKRFYLLICIGMITHFSLSAQSIRKGIIQDSETNEPLIGANVNIKNTTTGTVSSFDGTFEIEARDSDTMVISYIGYTAQEIPVGVNSDFSVSLLSGESLTEVVVTALGIKREKKALGYGITELSADDIENSGESNLVKSLQGRAPGVLIQGASGAPGSGVDILIRGVNSLDPNRSNRPLYVIDGIEVSDAVDNSPILPGAANYGLSTSSRTQASVSNRLVDINPDDIASISVLKGAAATSLYGVRAANGAIIITTKKGAKGDPKVSLYASTGWSEVNKYPKVQTQFIDGHRNTSQKRSFLWDSWGAIVTPETISRARNIYEEFYQTGVSSDFGASISAGTDRFNYRVSGGYLTSEGIVPESMFDRANFALSAGYKVSDRFEIEGSMQYTNSQQDAPQEGRKSIQNVLAYFAVTGDPTQHIQPYTLGNNFAVGIIDHPLFLAENISNESIVNRYITSLKAKYTFSPHFTLNYTIGVDNYDDDRTRIVHPETDEGQSATNGAPYGFVVDNDINSSALTSNVSGMFTHDLSDDIGMSITLGQYTYVSRRKRNTIIGSQFLINNFYNLNNTIQLEQSNSDVKYRNAAVYGELSLDYRDFIYLTFNGRNDWTSTLPEDNRSYFFGAVNTSILLSEMLSLPSSINFLKLRASYASAGKDASPYGIGSYYGVATGFPFGDVVGYTQSTSLGDLNLKPEFTYTTEFGAELKMFRHRLSLDASYFSSDIEDMILPVPVSNASGLSRYLTNAGSLKTTGVEALLSADIFKSKNGFNWRTSIGFTQFEGKVEEINTGSDDNEVVLADVRNLQSKYVVGGEVGDLYGQPFNRTADGRLILESDGLPRRNRDTSVLLGNAMPDFVATWSNDFAYKGFSLSFLFEWKNGGDVLDVSRPYSLDNGQLEETLGRYQQVVFDGVQQVGTSDNGQPIYEENNTPVEITGPNFYRNSNVYRYTPEAHLQDASWIRLRTVSLSYELPVSKWGVDFIDNMRVSLIGTNLFLDTPYNGWDPEINFFGANSNIYGYTGLRTPATKQYTVKLNVTL